MLNVPREQISREQEWRRKFGGGYQTPLEDEQHTCIFISALTDWLFIEKDSTKLKPEDLITL